MLFCIIHYFYWISTRIYVHFMLWFILAAKIGNNFLMVILTIPICYAGNVIKNSLRKTFIHSLKPVINNWESIVSPINSIYPNKFYDIAAKSMANMAKGEISNLWSFFITWFTASTSFFSQINILPKTFLSSLLAFCGDL